MSAENIHYIPPQVPEKLDLDYRKAMDKVFRWNGGLTEPTKAESDLDHIDSMLAMVDELTEAYPGLMEDLNVNAIKDMTYVHDGGEILALDLVRSDPEYEKKKIKHKRRERAAFRYMSSVYIEDPLLRGRARESYGRYTFYKTDDKEALFTHLIDKVQAVRYGLTYVFNDRVTPFDGSLEHAAFSLNLIFEFFEPLKKSLSAEARIQLSAFMQVEMGRYLKAGYGELYREGLHRLFGENPHESTLV